MKSLSLGNTGLTTPTSTIIDSGTTFMYLPSATHKALKAEVSPAPAPPKLICGLGVGGGQIDVKRKGCGLEKAPPPYADDYCVFASEEELINCFPPMLWDLVGFRWGITASTYFLRVSPLPPQPPPHPV